MLESVSPLEEKYEPKSPRNPDAHELAHAASARLLLLALSLAALAESHAGVVVVGA